MTPEDTPTDLLRLQEPITPYPLEPSDEEVAAAVGLPVDAIVRFDMNTLGGGPLPSVVAAHAAFDPRLAVEYGDQTYRALRRRLAELEGIDPRRIVIGAGADELIRFVTRLFAGEGDGVIIPTPTFAMFAVEAAIAGARVVTVPRSDPGIRQETDAIARAARDSGARLTWICSPNNPTADRYDLDEIALLASSLDGALAVDEVYLEFAAAALGRSMAELTAIGLQHEHPKIVVLRSLAKAYGLAGARIGYLVVPTWLAGQADAMRLPLPVGAHTESLALAALSDPAEARARHRMLVAERARLAETLESKGWRVLPSVTNFVLVQPPADPTVLADRLAQRGLIVRAYPIGHPLGAWLRIGARAPEENHRLLAAIADITAAGEGPA
jgi:histidinol-phosphate aminotransferase